MITDTMRKELDIERPWVKFIFVLKGSEYYGQEQSARIDSIAYESMKNSKQWKLESELQRE